MSGSVEFEFIDPVYTVSSSNPQNAAWNLNSAIIGLGYDEATGNYNTLSFKPSELLSKTKGSITINLNTATGQGITFGQGMESRNDNAIVNNNLGRQLFRKYINNQGHITFDGGENKSLKFVVNSGSDVHSTAFFLGRGSENISIRNVIIENGSLATKNSTWLPRTTYGNVNGFEFQKDTVALQTGNLSYSAGIVNRSTLYSENMIFEFEGEQTTERITVEIDTIANSNNLIENNEISGFGYGIVSLGIGPLINPRNYEYEAYYNHGNVIRNNKIYNVAKAGIVVGHEDNTVIDQNTIYNVEGQGDVFGIMAGAPSEGDWFGYNNTNLRITGNSINALSAQGNVTGILVEQSYNEYVSVLGQGYDEFPNVEDNILVASNAVWNMTAPSSSNKAGIHLMTSRDEDASDALMQLLTPKFGKYTIDGSMVANNTVLVSEDGFNTTGPVVGIGIQNTSNLELYNNAIAIMDNTVDANNPAYAGLFYQGVMPTNGGLMSDYNAYELGNASAVRFVYTDAVSNIIEAGYNDEYQTLHQWTMWTGQDVNSIVGNFTNNHTFSGSNPQTLHTKANNQVLGSILTNRGSKLAEVSEDLYGNKRGAADERYDIGAIEFNGAMYGRDAEVMSILAPGSYRSTAPRQFSGAEHIVVTRPVDVTARLRNNGSVDQNEAPVTVTIARQTSSGSFTNVMSKSRKVDFVSTESVTTSFGLADFADDDDFYPQTYAELGESVPAEYAGMAGNVTPVYRITISLESDEASSNNAMSKDVRFFVHRSNTRMLVTAPSYLPNAEAAGNVDELAGHLNTTALFDALKNIGWYNDIAEGRHNIDVIYRDAWEERNIVYSDTRSLFWVDGHEESLPRLEREAIMAFVASGENATDKKNLIAASQEIVRENPADFTKAVYGVVDRFPSSPLGLNDNNYATKTITGVSIARDLQTTIKETGVAGDAYPMPALLTLENDNSGVLRVAFTYDEVENDDNANIPVEGRTMGSTWTSLTKNVIALGIDWRHFAELETVLRGTFDFIENNGGQVVPVELANFDAVQSGKRVQLTWETKTELESSRFDVEKAEAGNFVKIDEVAAAGTSQNQINYGPVFDSKVEYGKTYT